MSLSSSKTFQGRASRRRAEPSLPQLHQCPEQTVTLRGYRETQSRSIHNCISPLPKSIKCRNRLRWRPHLGCSMQLRNSGRGPSPAWGPLCSGHVLLAFSCFAARVSRHRTFSRPENGYALQFGIFDKDLQEQVMQTYSRETYSPPVGDFGLMIPRLPGRNVFRAATEWPLGSNNLLFYYV